MNTETLVNQIFEKEPNAAEAKVKSLQSKERKLGSKMAEYAEYALPSYTGKDKQAKSAKYYKYKNE